MARLAYPEPDALSDEASAALAALPAPLNIFRMMANAPTLVGPGIALGRALLTTLELAPKLREMTILAVAQRTEAAYEWAQHEPMARAAGVTDDQIEALSAGTLAAACFTDRERAALSLLELTVSGQPCRDEQFAALSTHFSARELVELLTVCGYYLMLARIMTVLAVDIDPSGEELAKAAGLS